MPFSNDSEQQTPEDSSIGCIADYSIFFTQSFRVFIFTIMHYACEV